MNCVSHKQDYSSCVWALALHLNTTTCEKARSNLDPRRRRKGERPWDRGWVKTRKKWPAVRSRAVRHQIPSACRFKSNGKQKSGTFKNCNQHVQGTSIFSDSCCVSTTSAAVHLCPEGIFVLLSILFLCKAQEAHCLLYSISPIRRDFSWSTKLYFNHFIKGHFRYFKIQLDSLTTRIRKNKSHFETREWHKETIYFVPQASKILNGCSCFVPVVFRTDSENLDNLQENHWNSLTMLFIERNRWLHFLSNFGHIELWIRGFGLWPL